MKKIYFIFLIFLCLNYVSGDTLTKYSTCNKKFSTHQKNHFFQKKIQAPKIDHHMSTVNKYQFRRNDNKTLIPYRHISKPNYAKSRRQY